MNRMKSAILAGLAITYSVSLSAAPITFNTALPVGKGEFLFRQQLVVNQSGDDPGTTNRDRTEQSYVTAMGYGINSKWAVFGVLPYRNIDFDQTVAGVSSSRSNKQFGDLSVFARYSHFQVNQRGKTFRVASFLGIKLPSGSDNKRDAIGILPPPLQTATNSTDVFGGFVVTYQTLKYQLDSQISYRVNNEANNFEAGNVFRIDGSLQYRLWHSTPAQGLPDYLYGVFEINIVNQSKNRINNVSDQNSNGTRIFLSPGIQYVTRRWILEGGLQIPVSQNLNGTALENDYIVRAGVRFNF